MPGGVPTQTRDVELRDTGGLDQPVNREIAIPGTRQCVDEIADRTDGSGVRSRLHSQRLPEFVNQSLLLTVLQDIANAIGDGSSRGSDADVRLMGAHDSIHG